MTVQELVRDLTHNSRSGRLSSQQSDQLEAILADFLERLEHGGSPNTSEILSQYPELTDELRENFAKLAALHRAAVGMTDGGETLDELCLAHPAEQRILGDFQLIRPIGRGGMGIVYEAEQISLNRRVALKTLPLAAVLDPKQLARFKNEAQAAASLDHPHIVSVYAVGSDRGVHYYAMQFIGGLSLAEVVEQLRTKQEVGCSMLDAGSHPTSSIQDPASSLETRCLASLSTERSERPADYFRSVARLGIQAAKALHYAHEMGIVHRDVKPSNLLLDNEGQIYVTDFGLAMTQGSTELTTTGELLGTLRYMSPEQASGRRAMIDRRTDIYSLGASLYELATLRPAFSNEDHVHLLQRIVIDSPQLPSHIEKTIPSDLETIILKAMTKEPADRYETARALADDLDRFVHNRPIRARRITKLEHVRSWCRRNKAMAGLLGLVGALVLLLSIAGPLTAIRQARLIRQVQEELNAKNINQLYQEWYSGNVEHVGVQLERHFKTADPHAFHFEWELLRQLYKDSASKIFFRNLNREVTIPLFVSFSPCGDLIACGQPQNQVAIYSVEQKTLRRLENEPDGGAADAVFSADGKELVTVSRSGVVNRRDVVTSKVLGPVIHCGVNNAQVEWAKFYNAIHLSCDGKVAVVAMENKDSAFLVIARLDDGVCTRFVTNHGNMSTSALSPDGAMLVSSAEDGWIRFWDIKGNQLSEPRPCSYAWDIRFTADGRKLVICDSANGISVLNATTLAELPGLRGEQRYISRMAVSRDEILATVGIDNRIALWNLKTGDWLTTLVGHSAEIWGLAFSPDGKSLVSAASDETLRLWPLGEVLQARDDPAATFQWWRTELQFSAYGETMTSCARMNCAPEKMDVDTRLMEWDTITGKSTEIVPQGRHGRCDLALVHGTKYVLCGGPGEFSFRDRQSGELVHPLDKDPLHEYQRIVVSSDGKWAAGCGHILQHPRPTEYLAVKPAGNICFVAVCNLDTKEVKQFELKSDMTWYIRSIEFSPDGKFLVACGGNGSFLSRVDTFKREGDRFEHIPPNEVRHGNERSEAMKVAFSADSRLVGTVNRAGVARIWSLRGPKWELPPIQHKSGLSSLAFSPDARILALGDSHGIQLCDLKSQFTLATIPFGKAIRSLKFSPDGRTLAWAAADGEIGFLRAFPAGAAKSQPRIAAFRH